MQPNDQQGYYQPGQGQPAAPAGPPPPPAAQPQSAPAPAPAPAPAAPQPVDQAAKQAALNEPIAAPAPQDEPVDEFDPQWVADDEYDEELYDEAAPVTWTAHEYIHQEKGASWFIIFALVSLVLFGAALFLRQWSFAAVIIVIAVVIVVSAKRPPRELTYTLDDEGLTIDGKLHRFSSFKSFGVIRDGEEFSVMLIPTQRFQPGVTVYFPEESGEAIVDILGSRLPMRDLRLDAVDRIVRLLRL